MSTIIAVFAIIFALTNAGTHPIHNGVSFDRSGGFPQPNFFQNQANGARASGPFANAGGVPYAFGGPNGGRNPRGVFPGSPFLAAPLAALAAFNQAGPFAAQFANLFRQVYGPLLGNVRGGGFNLG